MNFSIKDWRRFYDKINDLGERYKDSLPTLYASPKQPMDVYEQEDLLDEIKVLMRRNDAYLDACGMRCPEPLWNYSRIDCRTWASHETFKFEHIIDEMFGDK